MKKICGNIMIALVITLSVINLAMAEGPAEIRIACTIPAIPGVNVPILKENPTQPGPKAKLTEEKIENAAPVMLQKETEDIRVREEENNVKVTVETIYSR